jgi:hypothetical protein
MKLFKNIAYVVLFTGTLLSTSCELTDVTDVEPVYQVSEDKVITNLGQAQTVLHGTYGAFIDGLVYIAYMPAINSMMGLTMKPGPSGGADENAFFINDVSSDNGYLGTMYTKLYFMINNANHVITKTELLTTNDPRKNQIIAEAKTLRALCHFYLLRQWGAFYDANSPNGIVLKDQPISGAIPQPRATVSECYKLILEDLDYAIQYGPNFSNTFYASNLAAKALKSKVLLYKKEYSESAKLALEVMNAGNRNLETTYAEIFTKKIIAPKEVIFQTPFDNLNDRNNKAFVFRTYFGLSSYYITTMQNDARRSAAIFSSTTGAKYNNKFLKSTFNGASLTADTEYFLRLDEIYLIYAEAVLRGDNDTTKALNLLNVIRQRSGNPLRLFSDKAQLLKDIRAEKVLELGAESGEEWFDLVRYHKEGDININDFKVISSDNKLILPLPIQTVQLSEGVIVQNPGY